MIFRQIFTIGFLKKEVKHFFHQVGSGISPLIKFNEGNDKFKYLIGHVEKICFWEIS